MQPLTNIEKILTSSYVNEFSSFIEDSYISKESSFQSLFSFKIAMDNNSNLEYSSKVKLSKKDCELLTSILRKPSLLEYHYYNDYYRANLSRYIVIFKYYKLVDHSKIFIGYFLKNSADTRLSLAEVFQSYIHTQLLSFS